MNAPPDPLYMVRIILYGTPSWVPCRSAEEVRDCLHRWPKDATLFRIFPLNPHDGWPRGITDDQLQEHVHG